MSGRLRSWGGLALGTLLIAVGSTLAGLYSFRGRFLVVAAGFILFFIGFRVSQYGYHWSEHSLREVLPTMGTDGAESGQLRSDGEFYVAMIVGLLLIALGVTMFSQTIISHSVRDAVLSGLASIGGYMIAHIGMMRKTM